MNALLKVLPALALVLSGCAENSRPIHVLAEAPMIINGDHVASNDRVSQSTVALVMSKNSKVMGICTGTLIFPQIVVTAAHCLDENPDRVIAVFATKVQGVARERVRTVAKWEQHPDWGKRNSSGRADVALVKLDGDAPAGTRIAKPLPNSIPLKQNDEFVIAGYGLSIAYLKTGSGVLRKAKSTIIGALSSTEIISDGSKSSICFGDSGGPAYIERDGELYLWGVASAVSNQACNELAVHTDVLGYAAWVLQTAMDLLK